MPAPPARELVRALRARVATARPAIADGAAEPAADPSLAALVDLLAAAIESDTRLIASLTKCVDLLGLEREQDRAIIDGYRVHLEQHGARIDALERSAPTSTPTPTKTIEPLRASVRPNVAFVTPIVNRPRGTSSMDAEALDPYKIILPEDGQDESVATLSRRGRAP